MFSYVLSDFVFDDEKYNVLNFFLFLLWHFLQWQQPLQQQQGSFCVWLRGNISLALKQTDTKVKLIGVRIFHSVPLVF